MTISQSEKARLPRIGRMFILAHKATIVDAVMKGETLQSLYDNWSPPVPVSYSRFAGLVRKWCGDPVGRLRATATPLSERAEEKAPTMQSGTAPETSPTPLLARPKNPPKVVEFDPDLIDLSQFK